MSPEPKTILVLACYEKGHAFLRTLKEQGSRVVLVTSACLKDRAKWPMECVDELFFMPDTDHRWDPAETQRAVSYLARTRVFDGIVPLDDFDVGTAAMLREHLRMAGMGETTMHYFRDKLAMRARALSLGIRIPDFVHLLNDAQIRAFCARTPPPWMLKPRSNAGSLGIVKVNGREELKQIMGELGDDRASYLLEQHVTGDVFHVDSLVHRSRPLFMRASRYTRPPFEVAHLGDVFSSRILPESSEQSQQLVELNTRLLAAMHYVWGASHSEFIRGVDGEFYFLETSARVAGAHLPEMIEAATGVNLWSEWAKIELAGERGAYELPAQRDEYAGIIISLARQEHPDTAGYADPEVVFRLEKHHHVGLIVRSPSAARVDELMASYIERIRSDFHAIIPPTDTAPD